MNIFIFILTVSFSLIIELIKLSQKKKTQYKLFFLIFHDEGDTNLAKNWLIRNLFFLSNG